jgi:type IV pilus assembly protein PilM
VLDPLANLAIDTKFVNEQALRARAAQMCVALGLSLRSDREKRS